MNEPLSTIMTTELITVGPQDTLAKAAELLSTRRIHHLPVVEGKKLVGLLTTYDLFKIKHPQSEYAQIKVADVMTKKLATLEPKDHIGTAAETTTITCPTPALASASSTPDGEATPLGSITRCSGSNFARMRSMVVIRSNLRVQQTQPLGSSTASIPSAEKTSPSMYERPEVVDEHHGARVRLFQQMPDERGFPGAERAGNNGCFHVSLAPTGNLSRPPSAFGSNNHAIGRTVARRSGGCGQVTRDRLVDENSQGVVR